MVSQDLPLARKHKPLSEKPSEESASSRWSTDGDIGNEDPLAAARGVINGVLLSLIIWVLIAVTWLVL